MAAAETQSETNFCLAASLPDLMLKRTEVATQPRLLDGPLAPSVYHPKPASLCEIFDRHPSASLSSLSVSLIADRRRC